MKAAELLGANIHNRKAADSGLIIADTIVTLLDRWRSFVPNGLTEIGYKESDLNDLVKGALPQRKVLDIAPRQPKPEDLHEILQNSMKMF